MIKFEIQKDLLLKLIKSHKQFIGNYSNEILSCACFVLTGNSLKVFTTDGNVGLQSVLEVNNLSGENGSFALQMGLLQELAIYKPFQLNMSVSVDDTSITFNDIALNAAQKYTLYKCKIPNYEQLFRKNKNADEIQTIAINKNFLQKLSVLINDKYAPTIKLNINKTNNLSPILTESEDAGIKQTAVLIPTLLKQ